MQEELKITKPCLGLAISSAKSPGMSEKQKVYSYWHVWVGFYKSEQ